MNTLLLLSMIGVLGFLCQWLSAKVRLPAILFLLVVGILLGPIAGILDPDALFGDLLFPYISFSVAVILFEGALTLKRSELQEIGTPVRNMVTIGALLNAILMAGAAHVLVGLSWQISALFGAIMVVTGPTVIVPMLKAVRPNQRVADVLRWEGIVIDPIGALFAVLVFEWIVVHESASSLDSVFFIFMQTVLVGLAVGLVIGYVLGVLLRRYLIPENLQNFASLASVCFAFAVSDVLAHESGLLAVTAMGMLLANMKHVHIHSILHFKEDLTVVFVSALFIVLAARIDFSAFAALGWNAVLLLLVMQFIARPAKVALSFLRSEFSWQEKALISWIGPRGIVAAAVSAVFALKLENLSLDGAEQLVPLAFLIIIGTVVSQSLTARPLARMLGVAEPETSGVLIIGANKFSIEIAAALDQENVKTLICDTRWDALRPARISGLDTYYGNPSSEHAHLHLNLNQFGTMLGLSSHREYNVMQAARFRNEFGARHVFVIPANLDPDRSFKHAVSSTTSGSSFIGANFTHRRLRRLMEQGATIRVTELSDEYSFNDWQTDNPESEPILSIKANGDLAFAADDQAPYAPSGSKLFALKPAVETAEAV